MEETLRTYDRFVDSDGKTTLNPEEYMAKRKEIAEQKKKDQKLQDAKNKKKGKL